MKNKKTLFAATMVCITLVAVPGGLEAAALDAAKTQVISQGIYTGYNLEEKSGWLGLNKQQVKLNTGEVPQVSESSLQSEVSNLSIKEENLESEIAQTAKEVHEYRLRVEAQKILQQKQAEAKKALEAMKQAAQTQAQDQTQVQDPKEQISRSLAEGLEGFNLLMPSKLTGEQLESLAAGTGLQGLGAAFAEAEAETGENALFIMAVAIHESNWGTSDFALKRNNLFGYQAYTENPDNACYFNSKEECILTVAQVLKDNYLTPTGEYYNGPTIAGVNVCYAADPEWAGGVTKVMTELINKLV